MEESTKPESGSRDLPSIVDFRLLFEHAPGACIALYPDGPPFTIAAASKAYLALTGLTADVAGRDFAQTCVESGRPVLARGAAALQRSLTKSLSGETGRVALASSETEDRKAWNAVTRPVLDTQGRVQYLMLALEPVESARADGDSGNAGRRNEFLISLDDATGPLTDPHEIIGAAARHLGEFLEVNRCAYADVEPDEDTFNLTGDFNLGVESIVGRYRFREFGLECLRLMRAGEPYIVEDSETDQRTAEVRDSYRLTRIRSAICVPLIKAGRLVGAMAVHQIAPRRWRQWEVELLQLVASRCWESIERTRVTRELQLSEQRLRLAQRAARIGSFEWFMQEGRVIWTPELESLYGLAEGAFEGRLEKWSQRVLPEDAERVLQGVDETLSAQRADYSYEFRAMMPDGATRWLRGQAQFFYDSTGRATRMIGVNIDIDDQKRAEEHLRKQWQSFDIALSHTPDLTYTFDLQGRFTYANRPLLQLLGSTLESVIGKTFLELNYPEPLASRLQERIQQVITTGQPARGQTHFATAAGETRDYEYIFTPIFGSRGKVEAVSGAARDVTERNRADEIIQEDRRRWRDLLMQAPAAIAVLRGPDLVFEWANDEFFALAGRTPDAVLGKTVEQALPELVSQGYAGAIRRVFTTGEPHRESEALIWLDPSSKENGPRPVYVKFVLLATRDSDGNTDGVFVHATVITDLVTARHQVEESEQQFRTLAETIPHLAWMADGSGHIFWYNHRWYDYTGTKLEDMAGWGWQSVHDPEVLPLVLKQWKAALDSGEPFEMIFPLKGADGRFRPFLTRVEPVRDSQGRVVRWFGTNTDIADQQHTEAELRRMNRDLEEFAYVVSHDLQEPLRMVKIYTQLLARSSWSEDELPKEYFTYVHGGVSRMETLIRDLLTFSRTIQADEPDPGRADLGSSLESAMETLKVRVEESRAIISSEALPLVKADASQLAHVFQNVLSNALKYRKADADPVIRISARRDQENWVIAICDNGIGFDQRYAGRIFGLFKRLHKDEYPGTGLGLAICKRIIERYGGKMWAEAKTGEGACFYFSLPAVETH